MLILGIFLSQIQSKKFTAFDFEFTKGSVQSRGHKMTILHSIVQIRQNIKFIKIQIYVKFECDI